MKSRWLLVGLLFAHLDALPVHAQPLLFTPENGLSGVSRGEGSLRLFAGRPRPFQVRSDGRSESDGSFTLRQVLTFEGQPASHRSWKIRQVAPLHYTGTLSDAAGEVNGHTAGRRLVLKYRVKGPLVMHQTLDLMPDGETIENSGRITLLGIPVGSLHETIRRADRE